MAGGGGGNAIFYHVYLRSNVRDNKSLWMTFISKFRRFSTMKICGSDIVISVFRSISLSNEFVECRLKFGDFFFSKMSECYLWS